MSATTCSSQSHALHEPLAGSASPARGYVLIEQPGSWGRKAVTQSGLDPELGRRLEERAARAGVRVLLTRRPGPHPGRRQERLQVALAHTGPRPWLEACDLDPAALADLDPAVCADPRPPGRGQRDDRPRWLVCTHARRDRCCATLGRPIADTLAALHPEATWEVSHLGGHRFAGTMLVLPEGLVYGRLDVAGATEVVNGHLAGRIDLTRLRGHAHASRVAQLAEVAARRHLDVDAIGVVTVTDEPVQPPLPDGPPAQLALTVAGRQVQVTVAARHEPRPRQLSCGAELETPVQLEVTAVEVVG